ncbi:MAG: response regulator [Lachnospirales bacterium]
MYKAIILDDEKWIIKSLMATIKDQNYFEIIGEAYDGIAGLKLIKTLKPHLVFADIQMPGMGGLELLQEIKALQLNTLFIIISGYAEFAYAQRAMYYSAIGYCLKPFSKSEITDLMCKAYNKLLEQENTSIPYKATEKEAIQGFIPQLIKVENKMVQIMIDYINQNFEIDIPIQKLADLCSINPNYASQIFSQEMGETFSSYLTNIRIEKAIYLLKNTDLPISLIASKVGYNDYFYFAKVFKKKTNITPTSYRKKS